MVRMTAYVIESAALVHRCQCCGEETGQVFCPDCAAPDEPGKSPTTAH
ncbi:hypothetical protein [Paenarthrobacter ilicis]|uniref:Small CPxCG-related zinc finger protein n=1 Tax=Paenarthrobacter ilicis TaxID=43665 RepID=A0ABX0TL57_9MICC|nr:hypothetical protein [Paenarthrobacter ilicis]MBM7792937.1 hypothetical protein [Paenarthrobacter ilicis]NIJ03313.1 hypothetical protein [Paenarthrobacter ilicis]